MRLPVIQGSPMQKASAAKAKSESIVSNTRTSSDPSLVGMGKALGESMIPGSYDYKAAPRTILNFPKKKKEKEEEEEEENVEEVLGCTQAKATNYNPEATKDDGSCIPAEKEVEIVEDNTIVVDEPTFETSVFFEEGRDDPDKNYTYRTTENGGYQFKRPGKDKWEDAKNQGALDAIEKIDPSKKESALELRNQDVYRKAIPGGPIRKKLMDGGYNPYKSI